jgi:hypothetical protein
MLLMLPAARAAAQGKPGGIGIQIQRAPGGQSITLVAPDSPAEQAGLRAGDLIVAVDGKPIAALADTVVGGMIRGVAGTPVSLTISYAGRVPHPVSIVRSSAIAQAQQAAAPVAPAPQTVAAPAAAAGGDVKFDRWVEPQERSFSVEVPRGWRVTGGLNWLGQIDVQGFVRVQSADGRIEIFLGDPELLARQVPNAYSRMQTGVSEGGTFRTPAGGPAMLQRFMTGSQYARAHAVWRLCKSPQWVAGNDLPDMSRSLTVAIEPEARRLGGTASVSAGETSFLCDQAQGYVMAATMLASARGGPTQVWMVYKVAGFRSTDPMRSMQARYIMEHMMATLTPDPAWTRALEQKVTRITGAVMSMQNAATQSQLAASRRQNETLAMLNHPNTFVPRSSSSSGSSSGSGSSNGVNTILGTKDVCDALGRCKNVSNDADSLFMDHSGNVRAGGPGGAPPDNTGVWSPTFTKQ